MADYPALDRTQWDLIYPPALVDAVSASANADASPAGVLVDLLVDAVSASANADASAATVQSGFAALMVQAASGSARYQASPCGVVQQGAEITTLWASPVTRTTLQGIQAVSFFGPRALVAEVASTPCSTVLSGTPWTVTQVAGISSTMLYSSPQAI